MAPERLRVTLISSDVSQNGLSRSWTLAKMLARNHEVEIVGTAFGDGIWPPVRGDAFSVDAVRGRRLPLYLIEARKLLRTLRADVVYAVKPLPTSFGLALLHRLRSNTPVVVDIDDDEPSFRPWRLGTFVDPNGRAGTTLLERAIPLADAITVATSRLQDRHGGVFVPHARDTGCIRPRPELEDAARAALGAAPGQPLVMFLGTPRPHKGIDDLAAAMSLLRHPAQLAIVGAEEHDPHIAALRAAYPDVLVHPPFRLNETAFYLQAADVIAVPQRQQEQAAMQMPAKLLDAMAAAKPIVATSVSDIPDVLANGRGFVVAPSDVPALAAALNRVFDAPEEAAAMGTRAREWCVAHASYDAVAPVVDRVVRMASARRRHQ